MLIAGLAGGCSNAGPDGEAGSSNAKDADTIATVSPSASQADSPRADDLGTVQSAWWSWAAGSPSGRNPVEDKDGTHCAAGQPSDRWFLAGTFGGAVKRRCAVPSGRELVAPVVNLVGTPEDCAEFMEEATGTFTLDGKAVQVHRWNATPITVTAVADNPVTQSEGTMDAHGCGLWAMVKPLPPGPHKARIRGASGGFKVVVDYTLTVKK